MSELGILVVEDDPLIREVICETLADAHFHVLDADNSAHAHEVLDSPAAIDAAFIDIEPMPIDQVVAGHRRQTFC